MRVGFTIILYLSQPVGKDKYALMHFLKESSYSLFHAFMVNSVHDFIILVVSTVLVLTQLFP